MNEIVLSYILDYGIYMVAFLMFCNGLISFPASEIILIAAGAFAYKFEHNIFWVIFIACIFNYLGCLFWYLFGRKTGYEWFIKNYLLKKDVRKKNLIWKLIFFAFPSEQKITAIFNKLREKPYWLSLFRCVPVIRCIISYPAGAVKISFKKYTFYSGLGFLIWSSVFVSLGYIYGQNIESWVANKQYLIPLVALLTLVIIILLLEKYIKKLLQRKIDF